MPDDMSIEEALSAAKVIKNHFKPLDKLHSLLEYISQLKSDIPGLERARDQARTAATKAQQDLAEVSAKVEADKTYLFSVLNQHKNDIQTQKAAAEKVRDAELAQIQEGVGTAKADAEKAKKAQEVELTDLRKRYAAAQSDLAQQLKTAQDTANARLKDLNNKITAIHAELDANVSVAEKQRATLAAEIKDLQDKKEAFLADLASLKARWTNG